jgi:hypothetical protein
MKNARVFRNYINNIISVILVQEGQILVIPSWLVN